MSPSILSRDLRASWSSGRDNTVWAKKWIVIDDSPTCRVSRAMDRGTCKHEDDVSGSFFHVHDFTNQHSKSTRRVWLIFMLDTYSS